MGPKTFLPSLFLAVIRNDISNRCAVGLYFNVICFVWEKKKKKVRTPPTSPRKSLTPQFLSHPVTLQLYPTLIRINTQVHLLERLLSSWHPVAPSLLEWRSRRRERRKPHKEGIVQLLYIQLVRGDSTSLLLCSSVLLTSLHKQRERLRPRWEFYVLSSSAGQQSVPPPLDSALGAQFFVKTAFCLKDITLPCLFCKDLYFLHDTEVSCSHEDSQLGQTSLATRPGVGAKFRWGPWSVEDQQAALSNQKQLLIHKLNLKELVVRSRARNECIKFFSYKRIPLQ